MHNMEKDKKISFVARDELNKKEIRSYEIIDISKFSGHIFRREQGNGFLPKHVHGRGLEVVCYL